MSFRIKQLISTYRVRAKMLALTGILGILMISGFLVSPQRAYAWTGTLPICQYGGALDWAWQDKIIEQSAGARDVNTWNGSIIIATFDNDPVSTAFDLQIYFAHQPTSCEIQSGK